MKEKESNEKIIESLDSILRQLSNLKDDLIIEFRTVFKTLSEIEDSKRKLNIFQALIDLIPKELRKFNAIFGNQIAQNIKDINIKDMENIIYEHLN